MKFKVFGALALMSLAVSPAHAIFQNGGFEAGTFANWTPTIGTNPGLTGAPPFTGTNIVIGAGGNNDSAVVGATSDPRAPQLTIPYAGTFTGRVNGFTSGAVINVFAQTDTITAADRDPSDSQLHVRFAYAPVLEDPNHIAQDQPYFYVRVRDVTASTLLYEEFTYSNQPGKTFVTTGAWKSYPAFVPVDVIVPAASLGHSLEIYVLGADCSQGGHGGYVYLDGFGSSIIIPGTSSAPIPTLSEWALIVLSLGLGAVALWNRRGAPLQRRA
jgi:hypothetical protein